MLNLFRRSSATQRGVIIAILSAIVFGLWPASVRGVYQEGGNASFAIIVTTWARALAMAGFCVATRRALFATCDITRRAFTGGGYLAVSLVAAYEALNFIPGPIVIIILFTHSLMLLLFLVWRGEERLNLITLTTTMAALGGLVLVLNLWSQKSPSGLFGIGLAFLSALAITGRTYVFGKQTAERHPIVVGAENFIVAAAFVMLVSLYALPTAPFSLKGYAFAALGSVASTLGTFGMFYGISLLGAFRWSLFLKLEPIFTALFSALILGESLKTSQYLGIGVVIASLATYQVLDSRKKTRLEVQKQMLSR